MDLRSHLGSSAEPAKNIRKAFAVDFCESVVIFDRIQGMNLPGRAAVLASGFFPPHTSLGRPSDPKAPAGRSKGAGRAIQRRRQGDPKMPARRSKGVVLPFRFVSFSQLRPVIFWACGSAM